MRISAITPTAIQRSGLVMEKKALRLSTAACFLVSSGSALCVAATSEASVAMPAPVDCCRASGGLAELMLAIFVFVSERKASTSQHDLLPVETVGWDVPGGGNGTAPIKGSQ